MLQPALTASQAGKTSRDFELLLIKTFRAKYYQKPPVAQERMPRGEASLGEIPVMTFFFAGHKRAFFLEILLSLLPKVTVTIKAVICHWLWTVSLSLLLEKHYFILKESTKNCILVQGGNSRFINHILHECLCYCNDINLKTTRTQNQKTIFCTISFSSNVFVLIKTFLKCTPFSTKVHHHN